MREDMDATTGTRTFEAGRGLREPDDLATAPTAGVPPGLPHAYGPPDGELVSWARQQLLDRERARLAEEVAAQVSSRMDAIGAGVSADVRATLAQIAERTTQVSQVVMRLAERNAALERSVREQNTPVVVMRASPPPVLGGSVRLRRVPDPLVLVSIGCFALVFLLLAGAAFLAAGHELRVGTGAAACVAAPLVLTSGIFVLYVGAEVA